jgi:hypothetical protein
MVKIQIPKKMKQLVWNKNIGEKRGIGLCQCCRETKISQMSFQCGHIISEYNGGKSILNNLVPICQLCNNSMGKINMDRFMKLYGLNKGNQNKLLKKKKQIIVIKETADDIKYIHKSLIEVKNIQSQTYLSYIIRLNNNNATEEMKFAIEKYLYKKIWNVTSIDITFLTINYKKVEIITNLRYLLGKKDLKPFEFINYTREPELLDFNKTTKKEQIDVVKDLIKHMGFDLNNIGDGLMLDKETFKKKLNICSNKSKIFVNKNRYKLLFKKLVKHNIFEFETIKQFMGFVNCILTEFGLRICTHRKSIRIDGVKMPTKISFYYLDYNDGLNKYI